MRKRPSERPKPCDELEIAVLGEAAVDWVVEVEALPRRDRVVLSSSCQRLAGGSAANVAAGLARLGFRVGFVGQLGDDENGAFLRRAFEQDGVDTRGIAEIPGYRTPTCWVAVDGQGDHATIVLPRELEGYRLGHLDPSDLRPTRGVYLGPTHTELAREVAAAANLNEIPVFYAPGGLSRQLSRAELAPVLERTDVLFVSQSEAAALVSCASPQQAASALLETGPAVVVETAGAEGAFIATARRTRRVPAFPVPERRDTTGAGDAFAAGFVAAFLRDFDLTAAARVGCAAAALKIRHLGARPGLPVWEEVLLQANVGR